MKQPSLWRRLLASSIDGLLCGLLLMPCIFGPFQPGLIEITLASNFPDAFLGLLETQPFALLTMPFWWSMTWCFWQFGWLYFTLGRSPGMKLAGLRVVDRYGDPPELTCCLLRVVGQLCCIGSLGLGWLWVIVSREGRSWVDFLSRSYVVKF